MHKRNLNSLKKAGLAAVLLVGLLSVLGLGQPTSQVYSFRFAATTTQAEIQDSLATGFKACRVWNNSATVVYLGGNLQAIDSTDGYPICTSTASCPESVLTIDGSGVSVEAASGTVNLQVICTR